MISILYDNIGNIRVCIHMSHENELFNRSEYWQISILTKKGNIHIRLN